MLRCVRIIVSACLRKTLTAAAATFVNMEREETALARLWKTEDISHHQDTPTFLIKPHLSRQTRCLGSPVDIGYRVRAS